jgi:hypothetical protein
MLWWCCKALDDYGGIARLDACSFEAFEYVLVGKGGVVGGPKELKEVRFFDREEAFAAVKVVCKSDRI